MQNIDKELEIDGSLVSESFIDKDGKNVKYDQIIVWKVDLFAREIDKHSQDKGNGYQPQEDIDDVIPF